MTEALQPSLRAKNLTLTRGGRSLFTNLDFAISRGEALVLRGANGSGKTSLLRVLAGLTIADDGAISWGDEIWKTTSPARRANVLYLGHANALKEELTTAENLADGLGFDGVNVSIDSQHQALERVGLATRRDLQARRLSQGQKRRIGLARLLLAQKPVWLLDEPTNALDAEGVALFTEIVDEHLARGGMACIATHLTMQIHAPVRELNLAESA
jgi:heme exporter protein A